jgi:cytochrome c-type biogenesis protein CcmH/NrfF
MLGNFRWMIPIALLLLFVVTFVGCAQNEHRKVTVTEQQHESEVTEDQPGEMVVE